MIERIPENPPPIADSPCRRRAKDAFLDVFLDLGLWERDDAGGTDRSALVLLGQLIAASVDTRSLERLTRRARFFLENDAVREDFEASLGMPPARDDAPLERR